MWFDWMLVDLSGLHIQVQDKLIITICAQYSVIATHNACGGGPPSKTIRGVTVIIALRFPKKRIELLVFFAWFSTAYWSQCLCANIFFRD